MKRKQRFFNLLIIVGAVMIIGLAAVFFVEELDKTISENVTHSISEIAGHDKTAIQTYIEICWGDLYEIAQRFASFECRTIEDIETRMNLECASSEFTHIYLVAEDGTVYTDKYVTYKPGDDTPDGNLDFLTYFANGEERIVARFDDKEAGGRLSKESILYGIRLDDYAVEGIKMLALIGISDISAIQDNMVIDNFVKQGRSRGTAP